MRGAPYRTLEGPIFRSVSDLGSLKHGIADADMIEGGCVCVPTTNMGIFDDYCNLLDFVGGDFWLESASKMALEGLSFMSVSGFGSLEYGIVDAEMIGGGCLCVTNTHTEALDDFCNLLVVICGDFGLEGGSKQGTEGPQFYVC